MKKQAPYNLDAERNLLGILLLESTDVWDDLVGLIDESDFFQPAHKTIFAQIKKIYNKGQAPDIITLGNSLEADSLLDQVGGVAYLGEIIDGVASTSNIKAYAGIIKEKSLLRKIIHKSEEFIEKSYKESYEKIEHHLDYLESEVFKLTDERSQSELVPVKDLMDLGLKKIEDLSKQNITVTGLQTPFPDLDGYTSGFQNSEFLILAARPSMGKSSLGFGFALHAALNKKKVAFFSLEMSREQALMRLLSSVAKVNLSRLMTGQLSDKEWGSVVTAAARLSEVDLYIDDSANLSPYEIRSKARRLKAKEGLDMIIIDYLQMMALPGKTESREREVSEISRLLKSFAKELQIPLMALSQLNRGVEGRSNRRPILSDLRESGSIEQDADVIMMLYREDYYNEPGDEFTGQTELIIGKQRNGPTGTVRLQWVPQFCTFESDMGEAHQNIPLPPEPPQA